jgi:hypothetical protein
VNDSELLAAFEDCSLPFHQWTHRAHVRIAYIHVTQYSFADALARIAAGIRKYNAAHKVPEGPDRGYNETTTHAFAHLVAATASVYAHTHRVSNSEEFCNMHPQLMSKHVLRLFYSPQRRMDPLAKTTFVEPDLTVLPQFPRPSKGNPKPTSNTPSEPR